MNECNILIIGPAWIGDMIMSQSLYKLLKQKNLSVNIDVLAPEWTWPLLKCMPEVREPLLMTLKHGELNLSERYRIGQMLRARHYTQAIILPNSWKSALIPWMARITKRTGWRGEARYGLINDLRVLDKKQYPLMVEQYLALGLVRGASLPEQYEYPQLKVTNEQVMQVLAKFSLSQQQVVGRKILALCPGSQYGDAKNWPAEHFAEVAKSKIKEDWDIWLFGAQGDTSSGEKIQQATQNRCTNFIGKTQLEDVISLISLSKMVISNDSGLMHVAAALNIPLIAIYGSSSPQFTPPLSHHKKILSLHLACSPCFKRQCPYGHYRCLKELKPQIVLEAMNDLMEIA